MNPDSVNSEEAFGSTYVGLSTYIFETGLIYTVPRIVEVGGL